jgi:hypothetical protein
VPATDTTRLKAIIISFTSAVRRRRAAKQDMHQQNIMPGRVGVARSYSGT